MSKTFNLIISTIFWSCTSILFSQVKLKSVNAPCTENGIKITHEFSGSVKNYSSQYTSFSSVTPANAIWLGSAGKFYTSSNLQEFKVRNYSLWALAISL